MHFEYLPHHQQKKQALGMFLVWHLCQLYIFLYTGSTDLMICRREEDSSDESEQGEMDEDEEEEIPLDMEVQYLKPEIC